MHSIFTRTIGLALLFFTTLPADARNSNPFLNNGLSFVENKGQVKDQHKNTRNDIQFSLQGQGVNVFIGDGQLHYQWSKTTASREIMIGPHNRKESTEMQVYRMDVELVGADRNAQVVASEKQDDYDAFYYSSTETGKIANKYNRITYKNVYPNIDWVLYSSNNQFKYDFVVRPGGNVSDIRLKFHGATALKLKDGQLIAETPMGSITEDAPYSYDASSKEKVSSKFVLDGNELSFDVAAMSNVVIDPAVVWSTYVGDTALEGFNDHVVDASGNVYITGYSDHDKYIATSGAYQTVFKKYTASGYESNGYVMKFNSSGQRLWGSYYDLARFLYITLDVNGNVYAVGMADSACKLGTPGTHQPTGQDDGAGWIWDVFVLKVASSGQPVWGTFFGSFAREFPSDIATDLSGNVIVSGYTESHNYQNSIASPGAHKTTKTSLASAFLLKLNSSGQRSWSTYAGNTATGVWEPIRSIAIDAAGNIYAAGGTTSDTAITSPGSWQSAFAGGNADGCIQKYSANGQRLWSTYYGNSSDELLTSISVDVQGNCYVAGSQSPGINSGFATPLAYLTTPTGYFLAKFNTNGQRIWGTYFGSANTSVHSMVYSLVANKIHIVGHTTATGGVATPGAHQTTKAGGEDGFLMTMDSAGQQISYGTYFGGTGIDRIRRVSTDVNGDVYFSGYTESTSGIATSGVFQSNLFGAQNGFLTRFTPDSALYIVPSFDTLLCAGDSLYVAYIAAGSFTSGNTFTAELSDMSGSFASPTILGSVTATMSGIIPCVLPGSLTAGSGYRIRVVSSNPALTSADNNFNITISTSLVPSVTVNVTPGLNVGPFTPVTFTAIPSGGGVSPSFQWRKNGVDIAGETNPVYVGVTNVSLMTGDKVAVFLTSSASCASPDTVNSAQQTINVNLGVADVEAVKEMSLYPNPNSGKFTLTAPARTEASIEVLNVSGQVVYQTSATPVKCTVRTEISLESKLANGIYMLRMTAGDNVQTQRFNVQR